MANPTKFTWTAPTTNSDGTPITAGEISGYQVGIRLASGTAGTYPILAPVDPASASSDLLSEVNPLLSPGSYAAAVQTLSPNGNSAWSAEVAFTITPSIPNPPSGFAVA
jgi:hypothetical protein